MDPEFSQLESASIASDREVTTDGMISRCLTNNADYCPRWSPIGAVQDVVLFMRERFSEPLTLRDLAEVASFSPYHFNRVFRSVTGISPIRFLAAVRMEAAKHYLLSTPLSVTEVCFEVGYNSLGTFTTTFTELVGLPPNRFRFLANNTDYIAPHSYELRRKDIFSARPSRANITGRISSSGTSIKPIFVGLFPTPIPQSRPVGCTILTDDDTYRVSPPSDGTYYVFAMAIDCSSGSKPYFLPTAGCSHVAVSKHPVVISKSVITSPVNLVLRTPQPIDPPVLVAVPLLVSEKKLANINQGWGFD